MGQTFFPNETNTIFLQVLRNSGAVPNFPADYTTPQVRVIHENSGIVTDLTLTNMVQLDDNLWSLPFVVPVSPFFGTYLAEFKTTLDSIAIESSEIFKVQPPPEIVEQGQGSCSVDGVVQDTATMQPIAGVTVLIFPPTDLNNAIAKDITNTNGEYEVLLNPGDYKIRFTKVDLMDETHDLTVNANCTHVQSGD